MVSQYLFELLAIRQTHNAIISLSKANFVSAAQDFALGIIRHILTMDTLAIVFSERMGKERLRLATEFVSGNPRITFQEPHLGRQRL